MINAHRVLEIPSDADERAIKRAYALQLRKHRPDTDPEGFRRIHDAYQQALAMLASAQRPSAAPPQRWAVPPVRPVEEAVPLPAAAPAPVPSPAPALETARPEPEPAAAVTPPSVAVDDPEWPELAAESSQPAPQPRPPPPSAAPRPVPNPTVSQAQTLSPEETASRLADAVDGQADDARLRALRALLTWQGACGIWAQELAQKVLKRLGRYDREQLDQVLQSATGSLVPHFMELRVGELNGLGKPRKLVELATAWLRRVEASWNSESGLPSLRFAIALMVTDRRLATTLAEHARDVLQENWYLKPFTELARQEMLASEISSLPDELQPGIRRALVGEGLRMTTHQRHHALLLLQHAPNRATIIYLQQHQPKSFKALSRPRVHALVLIALALPVLFGLAVAVTVAGGNPTLVMFIGIAYLRSRSRVLLGQPNFLVASPAGWVLIVAFFATVFTFNMTVYPVFIALPLVIAAAYACYRLVPSIMRYATLRWWCFSEDEADMRLLLVGIAIWIITCHALDRWGTPDWIGKSPGFGAMCFGILGVFLGSIALRYAGLGQRCWWLLAPRVPLEPRPLPILAMQVAGGGLLLWCAWVLPGRWTQLGDVLIIPALIACIQVIGAAWRTGWYRRVETASSVAAAVVLAGLMLQLCVAWHQHAQRHNDLPLHLPMRTPVTSLGHAFPPGSMAQSPISIDDMVGQMSDGMVSAWSQGRVDEVRGTLRSDFTSANVITERLAGRLMNDFSLPDDLVILVLDELHRSASPWFQNLVTIHRKDPRNLIAAHAALLSGMAASAPDAQPPATPQGPGTVPTPTTSGAATRGSQSSATIPVSP